MDTVVEFRLTARGKLPSCVPCPNCFAAMRRMWYRRSVVYECVECDSETTLDAVTLKELKHVGRIK